MAAAPVSRPTSSTRSLRRPTRTTRAPSRIKAKAQARPIPLPAPVTIATLFFSREFIGGSEEYLIPSRLPVFQGARFVFSFDPERSNDGRDWLSQKSFGRAAR